MSWFETLLQDLRYGLRMLCRSPGFTAVAVLSLALGIGANITVFSLFDTVLVRMLPVHDPQQLFVVYETGPHETDRANVSYPQFLRFHHDLAGTAGLLALTDPARCNLVMPTGIIESAEAQLVSGEYFSLLGVRPALGRLLTRDDVRPDGNPVVVISHAYWQRRCAGDPGIIGKAVKLNGAPLTIVGVAQPGFFGVALGQSPDAWIPLTMQARVRYFQSAAFSGGADTLKPWPAQEDIRWLHVIARVRSNREVSSALAMLNAVFQQDLDRAAQYANDARERRLLLQRRLRLQPGGKGFSGLRSRFSSPIHVLIVMVSIALLITCANVASLLLARAGVRQKEMAVRQSFGAGRSRLIQQLLTESALLAGFSALAGFFAALWANALLPRLFSIDVEIHLDYSLMAFTAALALASTILFGLAPALSSTKVDLTQALRSNTVGDARGSMRAGKALVIAQVALSLLLVTFAGLLARTLWNLSRTDMGFDREHVMTVRIDPRAGGYKEDQLLVLYQALVERVTALPGVHSAAISHSSIAGDGVVISGIFVPGYTPKPNERMSVLENFVQPAYFATVGMPILRGRDFDYRDGPGAPRVAIINEAMARRYFGTQDPTGHRYGYGPRDSGLEIIGVVRDARTGGVRESVSPMVFRPIRQEVDYARSLEARTDGDPATLTNQLRKAIADVAPSLPVQDIATLAERVSRTLVDERLLMELAGFFAIFSLALALLGIYGSLAHAVSRRTAEIGIRMALGAQRSSVLRLVLRDGLSVVIAGLACGLVLVLAATRWIASILYGVSAVDPITLASAAMLMLIAALVAAWVPARRASRVDPIVSLRYE